MELFLTECFTETISNTGTVAQLFGSYESIDQSDL